MGETVTDRHIVLRLVARFPGWMPRCDEEGVCVISFFVCVGVRVCLGCVCVFVYVRGCGYIYEWFVAGCWGSLSRTGALC